MSWDNLIGLEREKYIFQKIILENKLASAYCFLGLEGIGKDGFALEIAKTVNCKSPIISVDTISACNKCNSCELANNMMHPNIQFIFAQPTSDKTKPNEQLISIIKEEVLLKLKNPYYKINIPNAKQININLIRNINKQLMLSDISGHRFVIISNGENMNADASNSFLKTLEEPLTRTTIIITSAHREKLLPTIISRCQQFYFDPLKKEEIKKYLMFKYNKNETDANLIATMSQGSIVKACDYLDDNINKMRNNIVDILRISLKRKNYRNNLIDSIEDIIKQKDKKLNTLVLELLLIWLRDVYYISKTQNTNDVVNIDMLNRMILFCEGFKNVDYIKALNKIEKAIIKLNQNIDPFLVYIALFIELRQVFLIK